MQRARPALARPAGLLPGRAERGSPKPSERSERGSLGFLGFPRLSKISREFPKDFGLDFDLAVDLIWLWI